MGEKEIYFSKEYDTSSSTMPKEGVPIETDIPQKETKQYTIGKPYRIIVRAKITHDKSE